MYICNMEIKWMPYTSHKKGCAKTISFTTNKRGKINWTECIFILDHQESHVNTMKPIIRIKIQKRGWQ